MKKFIYYFSLSIILCFSCTQEDSYIEETVTINEDSEIQISVDGYFHESFIAEQISNNPSLYEFENNNSHLWLDESNSNLKSATSGSFSVLGYDNKTVIGTTVGTLYSLSCDSRIIPGAYIIKRYRYTKMIQIPAGATLVLPSNEYMSNMYPMGIMPGETSIRGYTAQLVSSGNMFDTYNLITEGSQITHNSIGQRIVPVSEAICIPCQCGHPWNNIWKYQYTYVNW